jgi:HSP20 family protein
MNKLQLFEPFAPGAFNDFFRGVMQPMRFEFALPAPDINLEVSENDNAFHVKAQVPGVRKEDIKVNIDGDRVSISTESKQATDEKKNGKVIKSDFYYGAASRSVALGCNVDAEKSTATYANGVLELTLPKQPSSAARTLAIQ